MKPIDFDKHVQELAKRAAIKSVNATVRDARIAILNNLPDAKRRLILRDMHAARLDALTKENVTVPANADFTKREQRQPFFKALPLQTKLAVYARMTIAIKEIAIREGVPELADLEDIRSIQHGGAQACKTHEDSDSLTQVTRDVANNVVDKHRTKRNEHHRLSIDTALSSSGTKKTP